MGEDIRFIVQALNRPPFNMRLTLVSFDSKRGLELLQVVNDVFGHLNPLQRRDLQDEDPVIRSARMLEFAAVLKYKSGAELDTFNEAFLRADEDTIYAFLKWMLERLPELAQRAYLARFLRPVVVPEEFFADEQIVSLMQKYTAAQDEFKERHKSLEQLRKTHRSPGGFEADIRQVDGEIENLDNKLAKLRAKVEKDPELQNVDFDAILQASHTLRNEQDEENTLLRAYRDQRIRLEKAQQTKRSLMMKLKELEDSELNKVDPGTILQKLRDDVNTNRQLCGVKLERELRDREKALRELDRALTSQPLSADMVAQIEAECEALQRHVDALTRQRDVQGRDDEDHLYRTRMAATEAKRSKLQNELNDILDEKNELIKDLQRLDEEAKQLSAEGKKPMTESELLLYSASLKEQLAKFKEVKSQIKAAQQEVQVLQQTEQILSSRDNKLEELTAELEKERGIEGYSATQATLDGIALAQSDLNATKGASLDELSKMVSKITDLIQSKRQQIQPLVKKIKAVRQEHDELEAEFQRKTRVHESIVNGLHAEREQIAEEIRKLRTEADADEGLQHKMTMMIKIQSERAEQLRKEELFSLGKGRLSREHRTYQDRLAAAVDADMKEQKRLLEEQRQSKAAHHEDVHQRKAFMDLRNLLKAKLASTQKVIDRSNAVARASSTN